MKTSKRASELLAATSPDQTCLRNLLVFAAQNPGFEWGNYWSGDRARSLAAYNGDARPVTRQLREIKAMRWQFAGLTDEMMRQAASLAYSGRLSFRDDGAVEYCTGQYWPTEYRKASLAVLKRAVEIKYGGAK